MSTLVIPRNPDIDILSNFGRLSSQNCKEFSLEEFVRKTALSSDKPQLTETEVKIEEIIRRLARKYERWIDPDDCRQLCYITLYRMNKITLGNFAVFAQRNILKAIRKNSRRVKAESERAELDVYETAEEYDYDNLMPLLTSDDERTRRYAEFVKLLLDGYSLSELQERYGYEYKNFRKFIKRAADFVRARRVNGDERGRDAMANESELDSRRYCMGV